MTLKKLLENGNFNPHDFKEYINSQKLYKVKKRHLDAIIKKYGVDVFECALFPDIYKLVSTKKSDTSMFWLTIAIFVLTAITTYIALFSNQSTP